MTIHQQTIDALAWSATASITTILLQHGLRNVWMRGPRPLAAGQGRVVGPAFTLRFVPAREDLARALSVTDTDIQAKLKAQLIDSGVIDKIRDAFVHSSVRFDATKVTRVAKDRFQVTISGDRSLTAMGVNNKVVSEPFKLELVLSRTSRTLLYV